MLNRIYSVNLFLDSIQPSHSDQELVDLNLLDRIFAYFNSMVSENKFINPTSVKRAKFSIEVVYNEIIYVSYYENTVIEAEDFKEALSLITEITNNQPYKVISEMGKYVTVTAEARKYAESVDINAIAEAVVIHSLAQRLLIRFYHFIRKHQHPFKIFESKASALEWMKKQ